MYSFTLPDGTNTPPNGSKKVPDTKPFFFYDVDSEYGTNEKPKVNKTDHIVTAEENLDELQRYISAAEKADQRLNDITSAKNGAVAAAAEQIASALASAAHRARPRNPSFGMSCESYYAACDGLAFPSTKTNESQYTTHWFSSIMGMDGRMEEEPKTEVVKALPPPPAAKAVTPVLTAAKAASPPTTVTKAASPMTPAVKPTSPVITAPKAGSPPTAPDPVTAPRAAAPQPIPPRAPQVPPPQFRRAVLSPPTEAASVLSPRPAATITNTNNNNNKNDNATSTNDKGAETTTTKSSGSNDARCGSQDESQQEEEQEQQTQSPSPPPRQAQRPHQKQQQQQQQQKPLPLPLPQYQTLDAKQTIHSPKAPQEPIKSPDRSLSRTQQDTSSADRSPLLPWLTAYEIREHVPMHTSTKRRHSDDEQMRHRRGSMPDETIPSTSVRRSSKAHTHLAQRITTVLSPLRTSHKDKSSSSFDQEEPQRSEARRRTYPGPTEAPRPTRKELPVKPVVMEQLELSASAPAERPPPLSSKDNSPKKESSQKKESKSKKKKKAHKGEAKPTDSCPPSATRALSAGTANRLGACLRPMSALAADDENFYDMLADERDSGRSEDADASRSVYVMSPPPSDGAESDDDDDEDALSFESIGDDNPLAAHASGLALSWPQQVAHESAMDEKLRRFRHRHRVPQPQPCASAPSPSLDPVWERAPNYEKIFKFKLSQLRRVRSPDPSFL